MSLVADLERRFGAPGVLRIDEGRGSLPRVSVTSDLATAEIYLHGAHLTQWQPRGARPVLFMSEESLFEPGKPIRGGVPVCFPWFGPKPDSPAHGFARIREWDLESCKVEPGGSVRAAFRLESDESTLGLTFTIGRTLEMVLEVRAKAAFTFEEALHTYFAVGDVRQVTVEGLENTDYLDKVESFQRKKQPAEPIRIVGETDRVYLNTRTPCVVRDPAVGRTLTIEKEGSGTTVVWNPWIAKSKAMADFGDDEWPRMICVETANVGDGALRLEAGGSHRMRVHIRVADRA
jgi:glucose-6-phosphate 1-epimerase